MRVLWFWLFACVFALCTFASGFALPGIPASALAFDSTGIRWAVCIGVSDYSDPDLADLPYARNDARDLAAALRDHGGFDRVLVFTDDLDVKDPGYPSRRNLLSEMDRLGQQVGHDDVVLFFFSGQGVTDPGGRSYLLPADARVRDIPGSGISLETVQRLLGSGEPGRRILFLDAARPEIWKNGPRLRGVYPDRYLRDRVSTVFYAAKEGTFSHDLESARYGVFAAALIAGMKGEADRDVAGDNDGVVSIMELGAYVDAKVNSWSLEIGRHQSPHIRMFDSRTALLALTRSEEAPDMRVLAAVREVEPRKDPEDAPTPLRVEPTPPDEAPRPVAPPVTVPAPAERPEVPRTERPVPDEPKTPVPPERPEPRDVVIARPAPTIRDLDVEEPVAPEETEVRPAEEPSAPPADEPPPPPPPPAAPDRTTLDFEDEERAMEDKIVSGDKALAIASLPDTAPRDLKPETIPPVPALDPVSLRSRPMDLPEEGVRALLLKNDFYATCWTYNGDFCNPNGEFINSYRDNGDGTVTDGRTLLMWQQEGSPRVMPWTEAGAYVQKLNEERFAGYDNWRLPTVEELASLMERSWLNDDLFVAPVFSSAQKLCWSADTKGFERAWKSNFHLGFFLDFPMSDLSAVRAVRDLH